jgi:hypothetical protein
MNTDFEKVMTLVLGICCGHSVPTSTPPKQPRSIKRVFVFSDMQFDEAMGNPDTTHFKQMQQMFASANVPFPQIVFWNLRGSTAPGTSSIPVTCDERGVVLLSGYSPSLLTSLLDGCDITPLSILMNVINSPRYDLVQVP